MTHKDYRSELEYFYGSTHQLSLQLRREHPRDYKEFIDGLYHDLDELIGFMEGDAKDLMSQGEDFLNRYLVNLLKARTYNASHDHDEGGHVDVHVRSRDGRFSWLGEAKLDSGSSKLFAGLQQLTDRYARGTANHNCGGLLIYVQKDKISDRMANWQKEFEGCKAYDVRSITACAMRPGLAFYSDIVLSRIGTAAPFYKVRHIGVSLYRVASATKPIKAVKTKAKKPVKAAKAASAIKPRSKTSASRRG